MEPHGVSKQCQSGSMASKMKVLSETVDFGSIFIDLGTHFDSTFAAKPITRIRFPNIVVKSIKVATQIDPKAMTQRPIPVGRTIDRAKEDMHEDTEILQTCMSKSSK